jgi:hypothetical protein
MKGWMLLLLLVGTPVFAKQKKLIGKADDPSGLLKVQTYCVDPGQLNVLQVDDLNKFVREQSKEGRLLTKLPWKFASDCANADAVATFTLEETSEAVGAGPGSVVYNRNYTATLVISERSTNKPLYKARGDQTLWLDESFISAFVKFDKDTKFVQESTAK